MKKITHITSDLVCVENIFAQAKTPHDLAVQICGVMDSFLSAIREAAPNLEIKVKDGPRDMASLYLEVELVEDK